MTEEAQHFAYNDTEFGEQFLQASEMRRGTCKMSVLAMIECVAGGCISRKEHLNANLIRYL